ncbi:hypothetical protein KPH14_010075 [Odynerus spinipes]|uniref:Uncharacterized protein n=1 Tax=Odynerus spinipes TaxID=1348599 RepID=A0AAD9RT10_9HYME|nr:hypothetical protein KPH14_010075 [Odynerus spinipes]
MEESPTENPAEPKADVATVAEAGLPENPEIVTATTGELSQEDKSTTEELTQGSDSVTERAEDKPEVHFASFHTSISYEPDDEDDTISVISLLLEEFTGSFLAGLPRILSSPDLPVEMVDKFTQTFLKAMTKISSRRFVELINMEVDHTDPNLVFFCASYELLTSFEENDEKPIL